ncbi:MAG: hypothetical protein HOO88_07060 [Kiritimatiellaceae bacterium]|nr:hypothetical protein [Kiritimatiellaceae bacterium]
MMNIRFKKRVVLSAVLLSATITLACSTPVFRYAIERWEADPYRLVVFSNGTLTEDQQQVVAGFRVYETSGYRSSPLIVDEYDISATNRLAAAVRAGLPTNRAAPCVALLYPEFMRMDTVVWSDDLTTNALNRMIMSPARLEIARRLLDGDAAVWVFIPGGDAERNRAIHEMLNAKLRELETTVQYNEDFLALAKAAGKEPPKLKFSVLELRRDNRQEAPLLAMLTQVSSSIATNSGPIVVPVFGQGRAAVLMMDEYVAGPYIEKVVQFLTGACSCEVKSQNPGFDILIPVDWVGGIKQEYVFDAELPPLKSPSAEMGTLLSATNGATGTAGKTEHRLFGAVLSVFIVVVLGGLGGATWVLLRKKRNHESS